MQLQRTPLPRLHVLKERERERERERESVCVCGLCESECASERQRHEMYLLFISFLFFF